MDFSYLTVVVLLSLFSIARAQSPLCDSQQCPNSTAQLFTLPAYGGYSFKYYTNQPPINSLQSSSITTGIIVIHGDEYDPVEQLCYLTWGVEQTNLMSSVYIMAPHFITTQAHANTTMFWTEGTWVEGGTTSPLQKTRVSSFTLLDNLLLAFINKSYFPSLNQILVMGHSGGGQTVQLYALSTPIDPTIKAAHVTLRYIAENAGSYAYLDGNRTVLPAITLPTCSPCDPDTIPTYNWTFGKVNQTAANCSNYNNWKFGLVSPLTYTAARTNADMRSQYKNKNVTYVLGTNDTCNNELGSCPCDDVTLDTGCEAELEGYCRFQRGWIYWRYLQWYYQQPVHAIASVPNVGHDGCQMLSSNVTLAIMFPSLVALGY